MMKLFITGGRGMVGKNIIALAEKRNIEVIAPSRQEVDLNSQTSIKEYLSIHRPDAVIHCAGLVGGIQANIAAPYDFCFQNLQIGLNVIQASYDAGVTRLINMGSSCMYPRVAKNPLKEEQILTGELEPTNEGYAVAKVAVAKLAEYISAQYDVEYKTLVPCNLYGYWDKFDVNKSHMIPAVIRKIDEAVKSNQSIVDIWGDGLARREFMFAEDLADFVLFSLDRFDKLPNTMNVGLGYDYSINDYYEAVAEVVGYTGIFEHDLTKPAGMKQKLVDVTQQNNLGWIPKTDLTQGIRRTYQFYLNEVL
ncbi:NAD-dependent epimerase/dehydratase [Vibrio nigripulchritudo SO65]|uniref:GDP-L-fucose synthase family protein n=1 Tax=Vibrio nigripulchritudo TaxID=28173 RepID=UPI0003B1A7E5|nr:GDP-L-fucose synthase [Vibrio nigripulchritudo]CCN35035.1 NAD-dependent epimerase/dehydratase [Vibrio nigripulchritudo AM115]CCN41683.1 NAD-dependent epimerase/dehydratase [Vibrio nigripulchritudo FTn2]CCN65062.1 NAD-dependent epimerase/dehydratase [Vibrio nigripulchritudo POn4]CCN74002.1 NAD-dependent epimerase/dehydratase [Vibrio nigripulchritudo SO65]